MNLPYTMTPTLQSVYDTYWYTDKQTSHLETKAENATYAATTMLFSTIVEDLCGSQKLDGLSMFNGGFWSQ